MKQKSRISCWLYNHTKEYCNTILLLLFTSGKSLFFVGFYHFWRLCVRDSFVDVLALVSLKHTVSGLHR